MTSVSHFTCTTKVKRNEKPKWWVFRQLPNRYEGQMCEGSQSVSCKLIKKSNGLGWKIFTFLSMAGFCPYVQMLIFCNSK